MDVLPNSPNVRAGNDVVGTTVCVCVVFPCTPAVKFVDAPGEVTHEKGHTGFLHFHSAVLALIFSRGGFSHSFPSSTVKSNFVY